MFFTSRHEGRAFAGFLALLLLTLGGSAPSLAASVNFSGLSAGDVITDQFQADGVVISAINPVKPFDLAILFDSSIPSMDDPDLVGPWAGGNIPDAELGMLLIISENDDFGSGAVAVPDDERDGGTLVFDFSTPINSFGLDLVDTEEAGAIRFYTNGVLQSSITFAELVTRDPTVVFGDNFANRINPFDLASLGDEQSGGWDRVEVELGGSGAVDNLTFSTVPEPQTLVMVLGGLLGLAFAGNRNRRRF